MAAIWSDPELRELWDVLGEPGNYEFPTTTEEHLDALRRWKFWFLELDNRRQLYLTQRSQAALADATRLIRKALGSEAFSTDAVRSALRAEIRRCFHGLRDSKVYSPVTVHLGRIEEDIRGMRLPRIIIFPIHGLSLEEGLTEFGWGSWKVFRMSPDDAEERERRADDDVRDELTKHYRNRTCIQVHHTGDSEACKEAALRTAHFVVDVLRLAVGCHLSAAGLTHHVGIELGEPWSRSIRGLSVKLGDGSIGWSRSWERGRQEYPLTAEGYATLRESVALQVFWQLEAKPQSQQTDLERALLRSLRWFSDAQSDDDSNISFVKYWTAMESLTTGGSGGRMSRLVRALVRKMSATPPGEGDVNRRFAQRGHVVHEGRQAPLEAQRDVAYWAMLCLICCAHLTQNGYKTRDQVRDGADQAEGVASKRRSSRSTSRKTRST